MFVTTRQAEDMNATSYSAMSNTVFRALPAARAAHAPVLLLRRVRYRKNGARRQPLQPRVFIRAQLYGRSLLHGEGE